MNFTREPIIETIISPKEGYKLIIRSSKGGTHEEYVVDAVEVVSFGHSFFYRCLERPKSFLVPVSDYEVVEAKETRVVLKNVNIERAIKIAGGKEIKPAKAPEKQPEQEPAAVEQRLEKKRERRRHRRRRLPSEDKEAAIKEEETAKSAKDATEGGGADDEAKQVSSSIIRKLIPPPTRLISEKELKEKTKPAETAEGDVLPKPVEEVKKPKKKVRGKKSESPKEEKAKEEPPEESSKKEKIEESSKAPNEEKIEESSKEENKIAPKEEKSEEADTSESGGEMHRTATMQPEPVGSSTSFSALPGDGNFSFFGKI